MMKNVSYTISLALVIALSHHLPEANAKSKAASSEVVFETAVGNLGLSASHKERGKSDTDQAQAVLPGRLFDPPLQVEPVAKSKASRKSFTDAVASLYSAARQGDAEWIVANWSPLDQKFIEEMLDSPEILDRQKAMYAKRQSMQIWGVVRYNNYLLVLANYNEATDTGIVQVLMNTDGEWRATNTLSGDETLDIVFSSFWNNESVYERKAP